MTVEPISYSFVYEHVYGQDTHKRRVNGWADELAAGIVTVPDAAKPIGFDCEEGYDFKLSWCKRVWIPDAVRFNGDRERYIADLKRQVAHGFHQEMYASVLGVLQILRHELICGSASRDRLLEHVEDLERKIRS